MTAWEDVAARSRGLSSRLLDLDERRMLAQSADLHVLATALEERGFLFGQAVSGRVSPEALELGVRRRAAEGLRTLAARAAERVGLLQIIFEDEDRRSLRALLRGAVQGASAEERLAGLIPTHGLPERALEELAMVDSPAQLATLLSLWRDPYAAALREARLPHPDLSRLETALRATFFRRATAAVSEPALRRYLAELVDLENARALLLLADQRGDVEPETGFLQGGLWLDRRRFRRVLRTAKDASQAAALLGEACVSTPWARVFERHALDPAHLDDALLAAHIRELRRRAMREPLGPSPVLLYALRLRAETLDLRRLIWGISLGVPRSVLGFELVEA